MALQLRTRIGGTEIAVTGKHEEDVIKEISFWHELPCVCGKCKSKDLGFRYRVAKGYDFYELKCRECGYFFALGQKKEGGLYPRGSQEKGHEGEWEPPYEGKDTDRGPRDDDRGRRDDDRRDERTRDDRSRDDRSGRDDRGRNDDRGRGGDSRGGGRDDTRDQRGAAQGAGGRRGGKDDDDIPF